MKRHVFVAANFFMEWMLNRYRDDLQVSALPQELEYAAQYSVFESDAGRPNGSIVGNDNDDNPLKYEPYYPEITNGDQVEIFQDILGDGNGKVTNGPLTGVRYLKDSRLLPKGWDKQKATPDIQVTGQAADDPNSWARGSRALCRGYRQRSGTVSDQGRALVSADRVPMG